jgi:hypothetical protein
VPGEDQGNYRKSVELLSNPAQSVEPVRFSRRKQRGVQVLGKVVEPGSMGQRPIVNETLTNLRGYSFLVSMIPEGVFDVEVCDWREGR